MQLSNILPSIRVLYEGDLNACVYVVVHSYSSWVLRRRSIVVWFGTSLFPVRHLILAVPSLAMIIPGASISDQ